MSEAEPRIACPMCAEPIHPAARACPHCKTPLNESGQPSKEEPRPEPTDATGSIIPYMNPPALIAYYCGVFSIIPCFPIGLAGLVLGIVGLGKANQTPTVKGKVHA